MARRKRQDQGCASLATLGWPKRPACPAPAKPETEASGPRAKATGPDAETCLHRQMGVFQRRTDRQATAPQGLPGDQACTSNQTCVGRLAPGQGLRHPRLGKGIDAIDTHNLVFLGKYMPLTIMPSRNRRKAFSKAENSTWPMTSADRHTTETAITIDWGDAESRQVCHWAHVGAKSN